VTSGVDPGLDVHYAEAWDDVQRFIDESDRDALDRAVPALDAIVEDPAFPRADLRFRLSAVNRRGVAHRLRVFEYGTQEDLTIALDCFREAIAAAPAGWPELHRYRFNLGLALSNSYDQTSAGAFLDQALGELTFALDAIPADHPNRALYLHGASLVLWRRYKHAGSLDDLDRSIDNLEHAARAGGDDPADPATYQLSVVIAERFDRTHAPHDGERALALAEASARARPDSPPRLTGLGNRLITHARMTGDRRLADRAVEVCARAVALTPPDSGEVASRHNNLGNAYSQRFSLTGDEEDLRAAIAVYRIAIEHTREGDFQLASRLYNLGGVLRSLADATGDREVAADAADAYRRAVRLGLERALEWALGASRAWGEWASGRRAWSEAAEAYSAGVEAANRLFRRQIVREHKESWLREAAGLSESAARALVLDGCADEAVLSLERGRALLLSEVLERGSVVLDELEHQGRDELRQRFLAAATRLERLEQFSG
jgi:hypothetical protein